MQHLRCQAGVGRDGEFADSTCFVIKLDDMLSAQLHPVLGSRKIIPHQRLALQESKFISESKRLLGLVLRKAGSVVPSTCEVVRAKVT